MVYVSTMAGILAVIIIYLLYRQRQWNKEVERIAHVISHHSASQPLELPISSSQSLQLLIYAIERRHKDIGHQQQEMLQDNERLRAIFANATVGLIAVNERLHIEAVNHMACKMFDIDVDDAKGRYILESIRNPHLESLVRYVVVNGEPLSSDVELSTGNELILRVSISPLKVDNRVNGAVISLEDITELKRLDQVKAELVANMSHEIKTPLTSIKGFAETLLEGAMDNRETCRRFLTIIDSEADRMSRLINDSLTLSRLESQDHDISIEPINLHELIANILDMVDSSAKTKNIDVTFYDRATGMKIDGNEDRMHQLMLNLIDNAIKYTPSGGKVTITIKDEGENAFISVKDTGIGIAKEHIPRLFERFYRVDKGRSRNMGGTGLGLAIVKHVVMSMNGTIDVNSELGRGTEFIVRLPKRYSAHPSDPVAG
ncbi:two-component system histidine kinase PnpS [Mahella sp.]|uniref:two-component system histidine kinase PnpS n=1 Tax=Mahella sp. TaxID=2798721 RepID=UPI0025C6ADF2|nr:ATP-binding protein [Mahella sp.]MBZ4664956.1 sensor signal transduction histidine kinase [Mahella sp.]MDK2902141.1 two-component system, OmpR family, phosphate regulon sensor histidine kinase PhoR [Clostridiales bacterium]